MSSYAYIRCIDIQTFLSFSCLSDKSYCTSICIKMSDFNAKQLVNNLIRHSTELNYGKIGLNGFLTTNDTNLPDQLQKLVKVLKFPILIFVL